MPAKGTSKASVPAPQEPRRFLRVHSRLSACNELRNFFSTSPIPSFRHQYLEAYVRAIAQEYESEPERPPATKPTTPAESAKPASSGTNKKKPLAAQSSTSSSSGSQQKSKATSTFTSKLEDYDDIDPSSIEETVYPTRKIYLTSGFYCDLRRKKNASKRFTFPLPQPKKSTILTERQDFKLPYVVYNELPPAPLNWKNLKKNMWIDVEPPYSRAPRPKCTCTKSCDEDCLNRILQYECDEHICPLGKEDCGNRAFQVLTKELQRGKRYANGFEVVWLGLRGYGLKSTRSYMPGELIIEYCGDVISPTEMQRRVTEHYSESKNHYFLSLENGCVIDSGLRGSAARFANHSCRPNAEMQKWYVNGLPRIGLFASESIPAGTELTYDYNFDWFEGAKMQVCLCGEPNCRGYIGKRTSRRPTPEEALQGDSQKKRPGRRKQSATKGRSTTVSSTSKEPPSTPSLSTTSTHIRTSRRPNSATENNKSTSQNAKSDHTNNEEPQDTDSNYENDEQTTSNAVIKRPRGRPRSSAKSATEDSSSQIPSTPSPSPSPSPSIASETATSETAERVTRSKRKLLANNSDDVPITQRTRRRQSVASSKRSLSRTRNSFKRRKIISDDEKAEEDISEFEHSDDQTSKVKRINVSEDEEMPETTKVKQALSKGKKIHTKMEITTSKSSKGDIESKIEAYNNEKESKIATKALNDVVDTFISSSTRNKSFKNNASSPLSPSFPTISAIDDTDNSDSEVMARQSSNFKSVNSISTVLSSPSKSQSSSGSLRRVSVASLTEPSPSLSTKNSKSHSNITLLLDSTNDSTDKDDSNKRRASISPGKSSSSFLSNLMNPVNAAQKPAETQNQHCPPSPLSRKPSVSSILNIEPSSTHRESRSTISPSQHTSEVPTQYQQAAYPQQNAPTTTPVSNNQESGRKKSIVLDVSTDPEKYRLPHPVSGDTSWRREFMPPKDPHSQDQQVQPVQNASELQKPSNTRQGPIQLAIPPLLLGLQNPNKNSLSSNQTSSVVSPVQAHPPPVQQQPVASSQPLISNAYNPGPPQTIPPQVNSSYNPHLNPPGYAQYRHPNQHDAQIPQEEYDANKPIYSQPPTSPSQQIHMQLPLQQEKRFTHHHEPNTPAMPPNHMQPHSSLPPIASTGLSQQALEPRYVMNPQAELHSPIEQRPHRIPGGNNQMGANYNYAYDMNRPSSNSVSPTLYQNSPPSINQSPPERRFNNAPLPHSAYQAPSSIQQHISQQQPHSPYNLQKQSVQAPKSVPFTSPQAQYRLPPPPPPQQLSSQLHPNNPLQIQDRSHPQEQQVVYPSQRPSHLEQGYVENSINWVRSNPSPASSESSANKRFNNRTVDSSVVLENVNTTKARLSISTLMSTDPQSSDLSQNMASSGTADMRREPTNVTDNASSSKSLASDKNKRGKHTLMTTPNQQGVKPRRGRPKLLNHNRAPKPLLKIAPDPNTQLPTGEGRASFRFTGANAPKTGFSDGSAPAPSSSMTPRVPILPVASQQGNNSQKVVAKQSIPINLKKNNTPVQSSKSNSTEALSRTQFVAPASAQLESTTQQRGETTTKPTVSSTNPLSIKSITSRDITSSKSSSEPSSKSSSPPNNNGEKKPLSASVQPNTENLPGETSKRRGRPKLSPVTGSKPRRGRPPNSGPAQRLTLAPLASRPPSSPPATPEMLARIGIKSTITRLPDSHPIVVTTPQTYKKTTPLISSPSALLSNSIRKTLSLATSGSPPQAIQATAPGSSKPLSKTPSLHKSNTGNTNESNNNTPVRPTSTTATSSYPVLKKPVSQSPSGLQPSLKRPSDATSSSKTPSTKKYKYSSENSPSNSKSGTEEANSTSKSHSGSSSSSSSSVSPNVSEPPKKRGRPRTRQIGVMIGGTRNPNLTLVPSPMPPLQPLMAGNRGPIIGEGNGSVVLKHIRRMNHDASLVPRSFASKLDNESSSSKGDGKRVISAGDSRKSINISQKSTTTISGGNNSNKSGGIKFINSSSSSSTTSSSPNTKSNDASSSMGILNKSNEDGDNTGKSKPVVETSITNANNKNNSNNPIEAEVM